MLSAKTLFTTQNSSSVENEFAVYIHIPFCSERCDYCAFTTFTKYAHLQTRYIDACIREIDLAKANDLLRPSTSVYIGGGTPSLIAPDELLRLLRHLDHYIDTEITVECNPESFTEDLCAALSAGGVNRISLGIQSLVPSVLRDLGRTNHQGSVQKSLSLIRQYRFPSHSVDIIYGSNAEKNNDLLYTLNTIFELDPELPHISAYALTVEKGTPLAGDPSRHPDEDRQATYYETIDNFLSKKGFSWYEISNWAKPDHQCRHNKVYWTGKPYLAIGCGAHGYDGYSRYWNTSSIMKYLEMTESGILPRAGEETLNDNDRKLELLFLKLRTSDGVPQSALDFTDELADLVTLVSGRYVLTQRGRLLANEVAHRLRIPI